MRTMTSDGFRQPRVLILSAGVGGGHIAAAEGLRGELAAAAPQLDIVLRNGLGEPGSPLRVMLERATRWQVARAPRAYGLTYALFVRSAPGRNVAMRAACAAAAGALRDVVDRERPDVIVSTYPGITAPLGMLRARGELATPVCAVITDLTSLHFWAHPGVDLHLTSYAQSVREIAHISAGAPVRVIRPPLRCDHWARRDRPALRRRLGLGPWDRLVIVSGGGWGVGDLRGAVDASLEVSGARVAIVCGQNEGAARRLARLYRGEPRVDVRGFVTEMADLLAAADVLVHSTGGVTCLEAAAHGCPSVAYGFAHGHVRHNVSAMARHGLLVHATDAEGLTRALRRMPLDRDPPMASTAVWASAAVLDFLEQVTRPAEEPAREQPVPVVLAS